MKTLLLALAFLCIFIFIGCNDESQNNQIVVSCITVDDCESGLICIDSLCKKIEESKECIENEDCSDGYNCNDGKCEEKLCASKDDCQSGFICSNQKCVIGCETNSDCSDDKVCDADTKKCKEDTFQDCRADASICEEGFVCNHGTGECKLENTGCTSDADCPSDSKCEVENCILRQACSSNEECNSPEICLPEGYCGPDNGCVNDEYCASLSPTTPICNIASGLCYECMENNHCAEGEECSDDRECVDPASTVCITDQDCGLNRKCDDGTCVSMFGSACTEETESVDCTDLDRGKCFNNERCVQCLQDDQCEVNQVCNPNTYLCEIEGSGAACIDDSQCDILAGESCINGECLNPNSSGDNGVAGLCDEELGGTTCVLLFGGTCNGTLLTNPNCSISDFWCGDCVFN